MNQILVTEKLYITPELKKKKKFYKFHFILSIFLICVLAFIYFYSVYQRDKDEAVSQELLSGIDNTTVDDDKLVVYLDGVPDDVAQEQAEREQIKDQKVTTSDGKTYSAVATISIPSIKLNYPVLSTTTDELLKISPCKFWGPEPNEVGNFCIVGHNYRSSKFFSKVPNLNKGDVIRLTDMSGRTISYKVYDKYTVDPTNVKCTSQLTNGRKEVTLITCTNDNKQRVVVKAAEA